MMYNLNFIEENEKNEFLNIINNKGLVPIIINGILVVFDRNSEYIFVYDIDDLCVNDINDILSISIVDSKYVYYLIDIAYQNCEKSKCKKKSL